MKILRELAGLFMADKLVMLSVPAAAALAWLAVPFLPRAAVALGLLVWVAGAFCLGVLRGARKLS